MHGRIKVIHVATAGANIAGRRTSTLAFLIYMKTQIQIQIGDRLHENNIITINIYCVLL